jgi:hypothetical protein
MPVHEAERGTQRVRQAIMVTKPQQKERKIMKYKNWRMILLVAIRRRAKQMLPLTKMREVR